MTIKEMIYLFDQRADRVSSKNRVGLPLPAKIAILNSAQLQVVKNKATGEPTYQQIQKRSDELEILEVVEARLKCKISNVKEQMYEASFKDLQTPKYIITRVYGLATSEICKNLGTLRVTLHNTQSDDIETRRLSSNIRPSLQWRRAISRTASGKIFVYCDRFQMSEVVMDYLRYPVKMDMQGYKHVTGAISTDVDCELPEDVQNDILNEAVVNIDFYMKAQEVQMALAQRARTE